MRIVIDLQGAQGASRDRGIGRYSLSLAVAIARNRGTHEVLIALNAAFVDSIELIKAAFEGILPDENIRCWYAALPVAYSDESNEWRSAAAVLIREAFLASLEPDVIHVTSIFEGFGDNAVHSIGHAFPSVLTAVTLYDLIPLIQSDVYLEPSPRYKKFYLEKIQDLGRADLLLAISASSVQEVAQYLAEFRGEVVNISAAADPIFGPRKISPEKVVALCEKFGITKPFIMYAGATDERKNHLRLLKAYSLLPADVRVRFQLILVGPLPLQHQRKFEQYSDFCGIAKGQVVITGAVTENELVDFYNLCHVFVFASWHEGFGLPALEAMTCGAPVIASNTSSLPEVIGRGDGLFDPFDAYSINAKLLEVLTNEDFRQELIQHSRKQARNFSWDATAEVVLRTFKRMHAIHATGSGKLPEKNIIEDLLPDLTQRLSVQNGQASDLDLIATAKALSVSFPASPKRRLFVDISELARRDHKTGIQRVVRSVLSALLSVQPDGYLVEPVYANLGDSGYRYARNFASGFQKKGIPAYADELVDFEPGDIFLGLDLQHHAVIQRAAFYTELRRSGVRVYFVIYDLLPVLLPKAFHAETPAMHSDWLTVLSQSDGLVCISKSVADEMLDWLDAHVRDRKRPLNIGWFHLGADVSQSMPSRGMPDNAANILKTLGKKATFLMVGTIEPRKGQLQALAAFEMLWAVGVQVNLVFVGKHGWNVDLLVEMLRIHSNRNKELFWFENISDEFLEKLYSSSSCLIAASEGEGFGLPLIEAAQHGLPIIARDIPVFREVAGQSAFYFRGLRPENLANAVESWLALDKKGRAPPSSAMKWLTWMQATQNLTSIILQAGWYRRWMPNSTLHLWGADPRFGTEIGARGGREMKTTGKAGFLLFGPYIQLDSGTYEVVIHYRFENESIGTVLVDVAINRGSNIVVRHELLNESNRKPPLKVSFSLEKAVTDLEVRIFVSANTYLCVDVIQIMTINSD